MTRSTTLTILSLVFLSLFAIIAGCSNGDDQYSGRSGRTGAQSEHLTPITNQAPETQAPPPAQPPSKPVQTTGESTETDTQPDEEAEKEPATEKQPENPAAGGLENPLIGTWVKTDKKGRKFEVIFTEDGYWFRSNPDRGKSHGTYEIRQRQGIVLKEDKPEEFHENGLLSQYMIEERDGKLYLGIRGFIGSVTAYEKQIDKS